MASLPFLLVDARTPQSPHDSPLNDGFPRSWLYRFVGIFRHVGVILGLFFGLLGYVLYIENIYQHMAFTSSNVITMGHNTGQCSSSI